MRKTESSQKNNKNGRNCPEKMAVKKYFFVRKGDENHNN
jgi:ribosomal protein L33